MNARGKILLNIIKGGEKLRELTILDISDYHAQLTPLAEAADTVTGPGAVNPTFPISGRGVPEAVVRRVPGRGHGRVALDRRRRLVRRRDAADLELLRRQAGRSRSMNLMGFDVEALGNHTFDRGEAFLRSS